MDDEEKTKVKIKAIIILEMIGRPVEHLKEVMPKLIETIGKEKGIKITSTKSHEPKKFDNKNEKGEVIEMPEDQMLYTTFSEVELESEDIFDIIRVCFNYLPSNIEIVEPESFKFNNIDLNSLLSGLMAKLHNYDSIAKAAMFENQVLAKELSKLAGPKLKVEEVRPEENNNSAQETAVKETKKKSKKAKAD